MTKPRLSPTADLIDALSLLQSGAWTPADYQAWDATRPGNRGEGIGKGMVRFAVSAKAAVSIYGLQRMPVTLYADQWERLLDQQERLKAFIAENADKLSRKQPQECHPQATGAHAAESSTQEPSDDKAA